METKYEIKEEVYKCSKCGLCKSVCPIFLALKNELYLPRGRFIILNAYYNLKNKLTKKFINDLDICLNCNACKNFCPSSIDSYKIFTSLKSMNGYKYSLFRFSFLYRCLLVVSSLLLPFKNNKHKRIKKNKNVLLKGKVLYFSGCYNKYIDNNDKIASLNLIEKCGYKVQKEINLCCGYPYINEGNFKKFDKNAKRILKSFDSDIDYIVCSCDSCFDTLMKIPEIAALYSDKLVTIDKFLEINEYKLQNDNDKFMYFKPLIRNNEINLPKTINIINKKGYCSLMENFFWLKYQKLSRKIAKIIYKNEGELDEKKLITTCLLSKWGLNKIMSVLKRKNKVISYSEYIDSETKNN